MEYGKIIRRSAEVVWQNKFLIILGILAALGGGTGNPGTNYSFDSNGQGTGQVPDLSPEATGLAVGLGIALLCVIIVVALVLWAISTVARGGLIAGVDSVERGEKSGFSIAWGAAWKKVVPLLGIGFLPAIPGLVLTVFGFMTLGAYLGFSGIFGEDFAAGGLAGLSAPLIAAACIFIPIALVLAILRNFAERACMLENLGVVDSYRRGTRVLMHNLGEAIVLFLLQIGIFIALGIALFLPGIIAAVCCFLWPLLIIFNGAVQAFLAALWTLAWRAWTGAPSAMEKAPAEY